RHLPNHPSYRGLLRNHYLTLTNVLLELGEHEKAAQAADELIQAFPQRWQEPHFAMNILVSCVALAEKDDQLSDAQRQAKVGDYIDRIQTLLRDVARLGADDPAASRALARFLALCTLPSVGDPERAIALAKQTLQQSLKDSASWTTLGTALYRAGTGKAALTSLEKAVDLRSSGEALDWFFLAMAHGRLGDKDKATQYYERAIHWMEEHPADSKDLRRIRVEAVTLLRRG